MSVSSVASYLAGQCTAFVAQTLSWVPAGWGNAAQWWTNAQSQGYSTGSTPQVGSIAVWSGALPGSGGYGHVAVVTAVDEAANTITVEEENYTGGPGVEDTRTVSLANNPDFLGYIYGPAGTALPASLDSDQTSDSSNPLSGLESLLGGVTGLSSVEAFAQRAGWTLLAFALVGMGIFLLFFEQLAHTIEEHPQEIGEAVEVAAA